MSQDQAEADTYAPYPAPEPGYVMDHADMLSDAQEARLEAHLKGVSNERGVEIVVVTIEAMANYPDAPQDAIETFATGLFDAYGIGKLPENDGVLLLVSRDDRKARIELGKGHGRYRDRDASRIMQNTIVPRFRQGDFGGGIESGVHDIMLEFAGVRVGVNWGLWRLIGIAVVLGVIAFSLFKSGQRGWGWVVVGFLIVIVLMIVNLIIRILIELKNAESSGGGRVGGWSGGSSWSSGGSSGGGFGGGSSGGGGATGSW